MAFSVVAIINFFLYSKGLGFISNSFIYDSKPSFGTTTKLLDLGLCVAAIVVVYFLCRYLYKIMPYVMIVLTIGAVGLTITNGMSTAKELKDAEKEKEAVLVTEAEPIFKLSKNGQNDVVFMLDRFISAYLPYLLQERPELEEMLSGFVYYPDTLTFGGVTYEALPAIVGGYEYMPYELNKRDDELLIDKHFEALKTLPTILSENGFYSTILDPGYSGGYFADTEKGTTAHDTFIFDDIDNVYADSIIGDYTIEYPEAFKKYNRDKQNHNMFFYSIMKAVPLYLHNMVYDDGNYYSTQDKECTSDIFIENYAELKGLKYFTDITEDNGKYYLFVENDASHEPTVVDTVTYEPAAVSKNNMLGDREAVRTIEGRTLTLDTERGITHYNVDMSTLLVLGEWFDWLRENDLYDNTRIILVSDHGTYSDYTFDWMQVTDSFNCTRYNAFLMVKDFNSNFEGVQVSDEFMTTADVPLIVMDGFVENPVNPYTGKEMNDDPKVNSEELWITTKTYPDPRSKMNTATQFPGGKGRWWSVHDSIYDPANWTHQTKYGIDY